MRIRITACTNATSEISSFIGEAQQQYGWPTFIDATTGKNRPDRIIKSLEKVGGALVLYQAVQSLDEDVLRKVKRQTIKLATYEQLQVHMRGRGLRSNSDLILGLPGETLETHLGAIRKLLDSGISQVTNFQLMLLKGTELETPESREQFHFRSRWRVLPKNFGIYDDQKVFDVEEIVVETDSLTFDDYLQARKIALASSAFWHDNWFEDAIEFAERLGVKRSIWLERMVQAMESDSGEISIFLNEFLDETRNELFPTREACVEFYRKDENFERLKMAEIGDNLMHKYRAVASFHRWPAICAIAMRLTRELIQECRETLLHGRLRGVLERLRAVRSPATRPRLDRGRNSIVDRGNVPVGHPRLAGGGPARRPHAIPAGRAADDSFSAWL